MVSLTAVLVFAIASFWTWPGASCHNNLKMAVSNGTSTFTLKVNVMTHEFSKFFACVCGYGLQQSSCSGRLGNVNVLVNDHTSFYQQMGVPKCTEVTKSAGVVHVRINYPLRNVECTGYAAGRYVQIKGGTERCSSNCAAFVTHEAPLFLQRSREALLNGRPCDTPCCQHVFGFATTAATKSTTREISTETASYFNATPPSAGANNHYHMHTSGSEVTVLALSLVTASLAVAAIIISLVVFWRHSVRSRSKKSTAIALCLTRRSRDQEDSHAEQQINVYSDLSRNYAGSIHGYSDLTHGNVESGRLARAGASECDSNVDSRGHTRLPIYDDITEVDTGYVQVNDD